MSKNWCWAVVRCESVWATRLVSVSNSLWTHKTNSDSLCNVCALLRECLFYGCSSHFPSCNTICKLLPCVYNADASVCVHVFPFLCVCVRGWVCRHESISRSVATYIHTHRCVIFQCVVQAESNNTQMRDTHWLRFCGFCSFCTLQAHQPLFTTCIGLSPHATCIQLQQDTHSCFYR